MNDLDPKAKLAHMAGQIARFFRPYPEDEAVTSIADHITQFWSRRMRDEFVAAFNDNDPTLEPRVGKALAQIRGKLAGGSAT